MPEENEMVEHKTYKVMFPQTGNAYVVVCMPDGPLCTLLEEMGTCDNCEVSEVPREAIDDLKNLRTVYETIKND